MAITIDCNDPKTTSNEVPCLQCISDSQLMVLIAVLLNEYLTTLHGSAVYDLPTDSAQLVEDSACYTCLSKRKQAELLAVLLGSIVYGRSADPDIDTLTEQAKCIVCADPNQVRAMILRLLCLVVDEIANPA